MSPPKPGLGLSRDASFLLVVPCGSRDVVLQPGYTGYTGGAGQERPPGCCDPRGLEGGWGQGDGGSLSIPAGPGAALRSTWGT